jgi:hypothetical protein
MIVVLDGNGKSVPEKGGEKEIFGDISGEEEL